MPVKVIRYCPLDWVQIPVQTPVVIVCKVFNDHEELCVFVIREGESMGFPVKDEGLVALVTNQNGKEITLLLEKCVLSRVLREPFSFLCEITKVTIRYSSILNQYFFKSIVRSNKSPSFLSQLVSLFITHSILLNQIANDYGSTSTHSSSACHQNPLLLVQSFLYKFMGLFKMRQDIIVLCIFNIQYQYFNALVFERKHILNSINF